jgi:hypothetical protein
MSWANTAVTDDKIAPPIKSADAKRITSSFVGLAAL